MKNKAKNRAQLITELAAMRQRIAELEALVGDYQQAQERLSNITANLPGAVYEFVFHPDGRMTMPYISAGTRQISGLEPQEAMSHPECLFERIHPDDRLTADRFAQILQDPSLPFVHESRITSLSGQKKWVRDIARVTRQENGEVIFHGIALDITEHKILAETQRRYEFIVNTSQEFMTLINQERVYEAANDAYCRAHHKTRAEIVGHSVADVWGEERYLTQIKAKLDECFAGCEAHYEGWFEFAELGRRYFEVIYYPYHDRLGLVTHGVVVSRDMTHHKQVEEQIRATLHEKEVLLKEVHHRVKNNLQVISSLLDLQAESIHDPQAISAFEDSRSRVKSMALVHEHLYQSPNLAQIDFGHYLRYLVGDLGRSYSHQAPAVSTHIEILGSNPNAAPTNTAIWLDVQMAIPCGLIVQELVTNALKHAFPGGRTGQIRLKLHTQQQQLILRVSDDGIGLPQEIDFHHTESLGLQLVSMLIRQVKGTIELESGSGTSFKLTLPYHQKGR